jgi:protease IV
VKQFLITVAGVLVGLILFLVIGPIVLISMIAASASPAQHQPAQMVLALDLRLPMTDQKPANPFASFGGEPALLDTLAKIDAARHDDHVKGLYVRANSEGMSPAQAEEIRAALKAFRESGKFVIAHLQNDGVRTSIAGYAAIADADEVWLQQSSELLPMGIAAEVTFFADTLHRYHMQAQFTTREEYKTAASQFTDRTFTPAHREEMTGLMTGLYDGLIADIAADRGLTVDQVRAAIEATPMTAERAMQLKLFDQLGRPEDAERAALARAGDAKAETVEMRDYHPTLRHTGPVIAVVQGEGAIVTGPDESGLFNDDAAMRSDVVARALLDAAEDDDVKAIVFRVSSPGGSVVASDQILHALRMAKDAGKKVVVSMGEVAASGGYYVAADADEIIAEPTTITGSIGVLGGKLVIGDAMEHYLSAHTERVAMGSPVIGMFSSDTPFSPAEQAAFDGFIDRAYHDFIGLVAEGRGLSVDQAHAVAHGRVWTGQQALERKLVDHLGGFADAVARAKALAGLKPEDEVQLRYYPQEKNPFEAIQRMFGVSTEAAQGLVRLNAALSDPRVTHALSAVREEDTGARAEMGDVDVR